LFVPTDELRNAVQHLRFRKHDVGIIHLLDRQELDFPFERPTRFVDMEGNEAFPVDPSLIARNYRDAVGEYLREIDTLARTTGVDYHRVLLQDSYEELLVRFLIRRTPKGKR
jgi:hypothetical protein